MRTDQSSSRSLAASPLSRQVVGNVGLFYVCYRLSRLGWNVMPTSRNSRGVDVVLYSQNGLRKVTVQVKALSRRDPVPLGSTLDNLISEFLIVCSSVATDTPECFVLVTREVSKAVIGRTKGGSQSYWLERKHYEPFRERWDLIGEGFDSAP